MAEKTFIKITNKDIYDKVESIDKRLTDAITTTKVNAGIIAVIVSILCIVLSHFI
jgi:predicted metal-dependent phosphotriesterase family hydrolase